MIKSVNNYPVPQLFDIEASVAWSAEWIGVRTATLVIRQMCSSSYRESEKC